MHRTSMLNTEAEDGSEIAEQWRKVKRYAAPLGPFSNLFSRAVRCIRSDCEETGGGSLTNLKPGTLGDLRRIFQSPTLTAMFYYALLTFHEEELKREQCLTPERITAILGCETLSSIIALAYLFRRVRHISDAESFKRIVQPMQCYVDLGYYMGAAIPELGPSTGLITGGMRYLAFAIFMCADEKGYKNYRLHLKRNQLPFDLKFELKQWGCHHLQLGSCLLQSFGFGIADARAYMEGLAAASPRSLDKRGLRFKVAGLWLDSLMVHGRAPETSVGDEFVVNETKIGSLELQIKEILTDGSKHNWLSRSRRDISPERTPELFGPGSRLLESSFASQFGTAESAAGGDQESDLNDFESM